MLLDKLIKSQLIKNILTLMSGTVIAQGVSILTSPILTRLYSPEDFGILAVYGAIVSLIAVASTGRYELAIVLPEKEEDSINIIALSLIISFLLSLLTLIIIIAFSKEIIYYFELDVLNIWIYTIPIPIFLTGIYQSFNYWLNRNKKFKDLAKIKVSQSLLVTAMNLYFGFLGLAGDGQILSSLIGQFIATLIIIKIVFDSDKDKMKNISWNLIKENAIKYKDFPKINLLHSFIDILQTSTITLFMSNMFSSYSLGLYSFSRRILKVPTELISSSISDVYYQKISDVYNNKEDLYELVKTTILRLSIIFFPIFIIGGIFLPQIFKIVFGHKWENAGLYSQILIPWILLNAIASPISQVPLIIKKQKSGFYFGLLYNLSIVLSLFITGYITNGDMILSLLAMSLSASVVLIFYILWILSISKLNNKNNE